MQIKRLISGTMIAFTLLCACSLYAQQGGGGRRMDPAAMKQTLIDSLHLSGVQADSVVGISQEYRSKMRDIFMDQSLSQDDKRAKMAPLTDERNKRIKAVLGDDLFKQYQAWEQRNRPQRRMGGDGNSNN